MEFDNEETSLSIFQELTNYKIDENKSDLENFDWKPAKTFKINEKDLELLLRISDEGVKFICLIQKIGYSEKIIQKRIKILSFLQ